MLGVDDEFEDNNLDNYLQDVRGIDWGRSTHTGKYIPNTIPGGIRPTKNIFERLLSGHFTSNEFNLHVRRGFGIYFIRGDYKLLKHIEDKFKAENKRRAETNEKIKNGLIDGRIEPQLTFASVAPFSWLHQYVDELTAKDVNDY